VPYIYLVTGVYTTTHIVQRYRCTRSESISVLINCNLHINDNKRDAF